MQAGKTIAGKRERVTSDSERERARKTIRKRKALSIVAVVALAGVMIYLGIRAFTGWLEWISRREEVITIEIEPKSEVIDDDTGRAVEKLSSRVKSLIVNLEEEFTLIEHPIKRVHIPQGKIRELDLEVEGFSGLVKVSIDRSASVTAEDAGRMFRYLQEIGVETVEYIDIRLERKAYWK